MSDKRDRGNTVLNFGGNISRSEGKDDHYLSSIIKPFRANWIFHKICHIETRSLYKGSSEYFRTQGSNLRSLMYKASGLSTTTRRQRNTTYFVSTGLWIIKRLPEWQRETPALFKLLRLRLGLFVWQQALEWLELYHDTLVSNIL